MSRATVKRHTVALVIVLEILVGAAIWFSSSPSQAQPAAATPAQVTAPAGSAVPVTPTSVTPATDAANPAPTATACPASKPHKKTPFLTAMRKDLVPIGILLVVIAIVLFRVPKINLGHSKAFRHRRLLNWLPLGLTYTFLYFARYNIKSFQGIGADGFGLTAAQYGTVFGVGSAVYGLAFLLNGPLADRWGGRATILIAAVGAGAANLWMGYMAATHNTFGMSVPAAFTVAFALNMYFQSFGAVSIVKVNAAWFHVRERGTFGGIFGILISLGLYFAFDIIPRIKDAFAIQWIFLVPAMILFVFFVLSFVFVRNEPGDAGHTNFDLGDATQEGDRPAKLSWWRWFRQIGVVLKKLLTHPVLLTIAAIELCSGFLRQAILQWGIDFGRGIGIGDTFVFHNWGMVACIAGITGGMFAGAVSDHVFQSRRSPVSGVLYAIMLTGTVLILVLMSTPQTIGWIIAFMSMAIIGVHGMLTATASADFAGKHNTGVAVGMIDGFVYLGSTIQSFVYGNVLPPSKIKDAAGCLVPNPEAAKIENWHIWPYAMIPVAVVGFLLTLRIWNAKPRKDSPPH